MKFRYVLKHKLSGEILFKNYSLLEIENGEIMSLNDYEIISRDRHTELKDKNGVDIYEGDVFTADGYPFKDDGKPNYNGEVEWIFAGFQYVLTCVNPDKRGISEGINEVLEDGSWLEIIGNIHETT